MTSETVTTDPFLRELAEREGRVTKAAGLLHSAAERLEQAPADESHADRALRLRGGAILAHSAALEVAVVSGWLEAAGTISEKSALRPIARGILKSEADER